MNRSRILRLVLTAVFLITMLVPVAVGVSATGKYKEQIGNVTVTFEFSATGDKAAITWMQCSGTPSGPLDVTFPSKVWNGSADAPSPTNYTVTGIGAAVGRDANFRLASVTIPSAVETIGEQAFAGQSITSVTFESPAALRSIGVAAFKGCDELESFTIPSGVTTIGSEAFCNCPSLETLTVLAENLANGDGADGVGMSSTAIYGTTNITDLTVASKNIPNIYKNLASLTQLTLGSTVDTIGSGAFNGCSSLGPDLVIPASVKKIGSGAGPCFWECTSLENLEIEGEGVTITNNAFQACTSLSKLTLPASVQFDAAPSAFKGTAIKTVVFDGTTAEWSRLAADASFPTALNGDEIDVTCLKDPTGIQLNKDAAELKAGASETLTAALSPSGSEGSVIWSSSNDDVATVKDGVVTAASAAAGGSTATITAAVDGLPQLNATCKITIKPPASITDTTDAEETMVVDSSTTLTVTVDPTDTEETVEWSTNDPQTVKIEANGTKAAVTALKEGTAEVTASLNGTNKTWTITVVPVQYATGIKLEPSSLSLTVGESKPVEVVLDPTGSVGDLNSVDWSVEGDAVAPITGNAATASVKGAAAGSATVTAKATVNGTEYTATCVVTVTAPAAAPAISVTPAAASMAVGETKSLSAAVTPAGSKVSWKSSNEAIATVSSTGLVTAVGAGNATITAQVDGTAVSAVCTITVVGEDTNTRPSPSPSATADPSGSGSPGASGPIPSIPPASLGPQASSVAGPGSRPSDAPSAGSSPEPGASVSPSPDTSGSVPGTSEGPAEPSAAVTPVPDTAPVELKPDLEDLPANIEVVADPENGSSTLVGVPISSESETNKVSDLTSWIDAPEGASVAVRQTDGQPAPPDAAIATGMCIEVTSPDGTVLQSTTVVVKGDVTGTGEMNLTQLVRMARGYTGTDPLRGVFLAAADLNGDGRVTLTDLVREARMFVAAGL